MKRLTGFHAILLVILVALLAGNVYFAMAYNRDRSNEGILTDELAAIESQIEMYEQMYNIEALEVDLESLVQQLEEVPFTEDVEDNTVYDWVRTATEEAEVHIDSWTEEDVIDHAVNGSGYLYRLFSYEATVSGALTKIFDFLAELEENMPYETMKIDDVELTYDSETLTWSITFMVSVYAQQD